MTLNELIQCLEEEVKSRKRGYEYFLGQGHYPEEAIERDIAKTQEILELISRQKAEVERLERIRADLSREIERLKKENNQNFDKWLILDTRTKERYAELYEEAKGVVKAEAIKEFAERLKQRACKYEEYDEGGWGRSVYAVDVENIDSLVKETAEEDTK